MKASHDQKPHPKELTSQMATKCWSHKRRQPSKHHSIPSLWRLLKERAILLRRSLPVVNRWLGLLTNSRKSFRVYLSWKLHQTTTRTTLQTPMTTGHFKGSDGNANQTALIIRHNWYDQPHSTRRRAHGRWIAKWTRQRGFNEQPRPRRLNKRTGWEFGNERTTGSRRKLQQRRHDSVHVRDRNKEEKGQKTTCLSKRLWILTLGKERDVETRCLLLSETRERVVLFWDSEVSWADVFCLEKKLPFWHRDQRQYSLSVLPLLDIIVQGTTAHISLRLPLELRLNLA